MPRYPGGFQRDDKIGKNKVIFEYGVNFKYNGMLTHNVDRVWVVTSIPIPKLKNLEFTAINRSVEVCNNYIDPDLVNKGIGQSLRARIKNFFWRCESKEWELKRLVNEYENRREQAARRLIRTSRRLGPFCPLGNLTTNRTGQTEGLAVQVEV